MSWFSTRRTSSLEKPITATSSITFSIGTPRPAGAAGEALGLPPDSGYAGPGRATGRLAAALGAGRWNCGREG